MTMRRISCPSPNTSSAKTKRLCSSCPFSSPDCLNAFTLLSKSIFKRPKALIASSLWAIRSKSSSNIPSRVSPWACPSAERLPAFLPFVNFSASASLNCSNISPGTFPVLAACTRNCFNTCISCSSIFFPSITSLICPVTPSKSRPIKDSRSSKPAALARSLMSSSATPAKISST